MTNPLSFMGITVTIESVAPKRLDVVMSRLITDSNQSKNRASIGIPKLTIHSLSALGLSAFKCTLASTKRVCGRSEQTLLTGDWVTYAQDVPNSIGAQTRPRAVKWFPW
ncbi:MAG: hypothetical protein HWE19_04840 [Vibrionaceae bacterium]|nr:hypothetical protein [Vibrionaceae bacterium]